MRKIITTRKRFTKKQNRKLKMKQPDKKQVDILNALKIKIDIAPHLPPIALVRKTNVQ